MKRLALMFLVLIFVVANLSAFGRNSFDEISVDGLFGIGTNENLLGGVGMNTINGIRFGDKEHPQKIVAGFGGRFQLDMGLKDNTFDLATVLGVGTAFLFTKDGEIAMDLIIGPSASFVIGTEPNGFSLLVGAGADLSINFLFASYFGVGLGVSALINFYDVLEQDSLFSYQVSAHIGLVYRYSIGYRPTVDI